MNTLKEDFFCVPPGEIYPVTLQAGEVCPPELVSAAIALGKLADPGSKPADPKGPVTTRVKDLADVATKPAEPGKA